MNDTQRKGTRKIEARQSQIGVIGDHAHIEGGIHFHDATPPPRPPLMVERRQ
jgi:hypothetical protein